MSPDTGNMVLNDVDSKGRQIYSYNYKIDEGPERKFWELDMRNLF